MNELHSVVLIAVIFVVTIILRFLPFLVFNGKCEVPKYITFLGDKLPYAIIGMLIIYCLRGMGFSAVSDWLPSVLSVLVVVMFHIWKRNTLLSIISGTLVYMLLVQLVFA